MKPCPQKWFSKEADFPTNQIEIFSTLEQPIMISVIQTFRNTLKLNENDRIINFVISSYHITTLSEFRYLQAITVFFCTTVIGYLNYLQLLEFG